MIEFLAAIFTLLCVILTVKLNKWCWPVSIIASLLYMGLFLNKHIYFQAGLQVIFIILSIKGWYNWGKIKNTKLNLDSWKDLIIHLVIVLILTVFITTYLKNKIIHPQLSLDIVTTLLSILGTWYLTTKNVFAWLIWAITNSFLVVLFLDIQMYWSVALYTILLILTIKGTVEWTKDIKTL